MTAHLVGIPAVVTRHLKALVWNVLRDRCDEIARREYLKVALFVVRAPATLGKRISIN